MPNKYIRIKHNTILTTAPMVINALYNRILFTINKYCLLISIFNGMINTSIAKMVINGTVDAKASPKNHK
ncbi:hypothetical protein SASK175_04120 [Staphylococcus argenteus]